MPSGLNGMAQPIGQGPSLVQQSGQAKAGALGTLASFDNVQTIIKSGTQAVVQAFQDSEIQKDKFTTFAQLNTLTGTAEMSLKKLYLDPIKGNGGGMYDISLAVNFSARTIDVKMEGYYKLGKLGLDTGTLESPDIYSYANKKGPAEGIINYLSHQGAKIEVALVAKNFGGRIADTIAHTVTVSDKKGDNVIQTRGGQGIMGRP